MADDTREDLIGRITGHLPMLVTSDLEKLCRQINVVAHLNELRAASNKEPTRLFKSEEEQPYAELPYEE
ncbi:MAG: hypothetical protein V3T84_04870 [Phycisphaerales bacterium]